MCGRDTQPAKQSNRKCKAHSKEAQVKIRKYTSISSHELNHNIFPGSFLLTKTACSIISLFTVVHGYRNLLN